MDGPTNPVDVGTKKDRTEKAPVVLNRMIKEGLSHPRYSADFHTRTMQTRLQTTFLQVSRVRRGATQRDYTLLNYKFCGFAAAGKSGMVGFGTVGMVFPKYDNYVNIFFALRAAWSL